MNQLKNFSLLDPDLIRLGESQTRQIRVDHIIGTVSKEQELSAKKKDSLVMTEIVEKEIAPEISQFIQTRQEEPYISPDLQRAGVKKNITVPLYAGQKTIILPLTDDMVEKGLHAPLTSSFRWLAEWSVFLLKKAHIVLRKVHGHMKRVIQQ